MDWIDGVDCIDYYTGIFGSYDNIPYSLKQELIPLHNTRWVCPDIKSFTLQNDPYNYNFGQNFNWVVNFCDVVAARKGVVDPDCVPNDSTEMWDYINYARISTKYVRQYFNPEYFMEYRTMEYIAENRQEIDFSKDVTPTNYYNIQRNTAKFYENKYFDFSSFFFIPVTTI